MLGFARSLFDDLASEMGAGAVQTPGLNPAMGTDLPEPGAFVPAGPMTMTPPVDDGSMDGDSAMNDAANPSPSASDPTVGPMDPAAQDDGTPPAEQDPAMMDPAMPSDDPSMMTPVDGGEPPGFEGIVAAHNAVRAGLGEDLPDLVWSQAIADIAQGWADTLAQDCSFSHNPALQTLRLGENLSSFGSAPNFPNTEGADAVDGWSAEVACWDYGIFMQGDACDAQCVAAQNSNGCGHYTQVVWRNTQSVGCGFSTCTSAGFNRELWVCNYDPPGNFVGQLPY